jgi:small GTP-binding protein
MSEVRPFKVVLLGDAGVGKTSIIIRFVDDSWDKIMDPTIGQTFLKTTVEVDNQIVALNLWDTPGQERYASQNSFVIRDADCCVVVYDASIADGSSYEVIEPTIERYRALCTRSAPFVIIVGNKSDKLPSNLQEAELEKLEERHNSFRVMSFLASAKTGENITELFASVARLLVKRTTDCRTPETTMTISIDGEHRKRKRSCC